MLATRKQNWGEDRVMYYGPSGRLRSLPSSWTSLEERDAFSRAAAGRALFRVDDLLRLCALLEARLGGAPDVK